MPEYKVWGTSQDGLIEYIPLTKDLLESSLKAMQQSFYINENVCAAFGVPDEPKCFPEMDVLLHRAALDGVSIVARDTVTGKIAGAAFNKLEAPGDGICDFFSRHIKSCKYSQSRNLTEWMLELDGLFNIYDYCKVNSVMEIMFVGTVPEFRKRGIAKKLFEVSIEVARSLKQGQNVKVPIDGKPLELGNPPQVVTAICTSFITQKIAKDINFRSATQIEFERFSTNGKSLGKIIKNTPFLTYDYICV